MEGLSPGSRFEVFLELRLLATVEMHNSQVQRPGFFD